MIAAGILALGTIRLSSPYLLASMGGLLSERSGVINIALEGNMLMGAVATGLVGVSTGNPWIGLAAGIVAAIAMSLLHWLLTQVYSLDHIVSGMAINAIALGGSNFLDKTFTNPDKANKVPGLPFELYYGAAFLLPMLLYLYLRHTRGGLRLLAVGNDPNKSRQVGLFPKRVRLASLIGTGFLCGVAGAVIVTTAGSFVDNMTAGRGYIALAALIIGGWRPLYAGIACIVFGFFESLQIVLQGTVAGIAPEVWQSLPYVVTVIALAGFLGKSRAPMGLGKA